MKNLGNIVLKSGGLNLTLLDLLRRLHERDRLLDLLIDAGVDITVTTAARSAGVHVSNTELQQAANRFRQQKGLQTADETTAWLANRCLSTEQFERHLEHELLVEKFMDYLLARYGQQHFNNEQNSYGRVKLRRICVRTRSEAQELLSQIREDGAGFPELAALHSIDPHDRLTQGDLGLVHLRELPEELQRLLKGAAAGAVIGPLHGALGFELYFAEVLFPALYDSMTQQLIRDNLYRTFVRRQVEATVVNGDLLSETQNEPLPAAESPNGPSDVALSDLG